MEREILALTDRLIENTIEISMLSGEELERKQAEGVNIVVQLAAVLEAYLGGSPEHFAQVIKELARQKLPDENILASFGEFSTYLEEAIHHGLRLYHENRPMPEDITGAAPTEPEEANDAGAVEEASPVPSGAGGTGEECTVTWDEPAETVTTPAHHSTNTGAEEETVKTDNHVEPAAGLMPSSWDHEVDVSSPPEPAPASEQASSSLTPETGSATGPPADGENCLSAADTSENQASIPVNDTDQDHWQAALKLVFPEATIIKNHTVKGLAFSYYIPEYAIAIDLNPTDKKETIWKEYYCRQENIRLLSIAMQENSRIRHIVRSLRLSLAQNISQNIS